MTTKQKLFAALLADAHGLDPEYAAFLAWRHLDDLEEADVDTLPTLARQAAEEADPRWLAADQLRRRRADLLAREFLSYTL